MSRPEDDDGAAFGVRTRARGTSKKRLGGRARKPVKRGSVSQILWSGDHADRPTTTTAYADADMQRLYDRGRFDTLVGKLRGGKEATVYVVRRGEESLIAKLYTDLALRSFKRDESYWTGYWIGDKRVTKAMRQGSRAGLDARQGIWVFREYSMLWRLHAAGVPVPRPAMGPNVSELQESGTVVLMQLIGDGDQPAPRLSDVRLTAEDARSAWDQAVAIYLRLAELDLVHGDLSTYNLLWHDRVVWLIDVPQAKEISSAKDGFDLLRRDLDSLVTSFRRLGHEGEAENVWRQAQALARQHEGM